MQLRSHPAVTLTPDTVVIGDSTYATTELTVVDAIADSIVIVWKGGRISRYGGSYSTWLRPVHFGVDSVEFTGFASGLDSQVQVHELVTITPRGLPPLAELLASLDSVHAVVLLDQPAVGRVALLSRKFTLAGQTFAQRLGTTFAWDPVAGAYQPVAATFGVPDTVASAVAYAGWSSLSSPWSGLPRQLSSLSDGLFEPVAFALRVLRGPTF